jgi:tetratricopeptide (TPR) repeat protein
VYRKQGRAEQSHPDRQEQLYDKADKLLNDIFEVIPQVQQKVSPEDSMTFSNFKAGIEMERGQYEDAAHSYRKIAEDRTEVWGSNLHPSVLWAEQQEAVAYERLPDLEKAIQIYLRILPLQESTLRPDHPNTRETISHLWAIFNETRQSWYMETRWDLLGVIISAAIRAEHSRIQGLMRRTSRNASRRIRHTTMQFAANKLKATKNWTYIHRIHIIMPTNSYNIHLSQPKQLLFFVLLAIIAAIYALHQG